MDGHARCVATVHWIRTKPTDKNGNKLPLEMYIKKICKAKGWDYKPPVVTKKDEE